MYEVIYTGQFQILIKPYSHIQKLFLQLFGGFTFSFSFAIERYDLTKNDMERNQIIDNIWVAARVLPKGSTLYLYDSRARSDWHEDSDWNLLLLPTNKVQ